MSTRNELWLAGVAFALALGVSTAHAQHDHHDICDPSVEEPDPVLHVPDFNADGKVTGLDVAAVSQAIEKAEASGYYYAGYDLNADGVLDDADRRMVTDQIGDEVPAKETEIARVVAFAERYMDINNAIADGYIPTTNEKEGHGVHWSLTSRESDPFTVDRPYGLNYTADGELLAVFWYVDYEVSPQTPEGFTGQEDMWHVHENSCLFYAGGRDENGELDPELTYYADFVDRRFGVSQGVVDAWEAAAMYAMGLGLMEPCDPDAHGCPPHWFYVSEDFNSCTVLQEVLESAGFLSTEGISNPDEVVTSFIDGFHMLHLWVGKPNPCGRFAGTHPEVTGEPIPPVPDSHHD